MQASKLAPATTPDFTFNAGLDIFFTFDGLVFIVLSLLLSKHINLLAYAFFLFDILSSLISFCEPVSNNNSD